MEIFKRFYRTITAVFRQTWLLPRSLSIATRLRRRQAAREEFETERLDRIRNPSKYLGK